ncbi:hypothetical protein QVD17_28318 [Tagetes erecta]|uniref:Uncharacterized protein n=1 Tax=Tagetes erecta TaxID=13708 RepID=A0AAD8KAH1_TARER|nr:hypothetical protein QVD17_28318 [Tagetes erecta]
MQIRFSQQALTQDTRGTIGSPLKLTFSDGEPLEKECPQRNRYPPIYAFSFDDIINIHNSCNSSPRLRKAINAIMITTSWKMSAVCGSQLQKKRWTKHLQSATRRLFMKVSNSSLQTLEDLRNGWFKSAPGRGHADLFNETPKFTLNDMFPTKQIVCNTTSHHHHQQETCNPN